MDKTLYFTAENVIKCIIRKKRISKVSYFLLTLRKTFLIEVIIFNVLFYFGLNILYDFKLTRTKPQVDFSDHLLFIVRLSVCILYTFSSSSLESLSEVQPNLAKNHYPVILKRAFSPTGDNSKIAKLHCLYLAKLKNFFSRFFWNKFNQAWNKASMCEGNVSSSNKGTRPIDDI